MICTLALYGLFEIAKTIYQFFTYTNFTTDGIHVIVAVKNAENQVEGFLRSVIFKLIYYGKEDIIKNLMITDLKSNDTTTTILDKMQKDYPFLKITDWEECNKIIKNL